MDPRGDSLRARVHRVQRGEPGQPLLRAGLTALGALYGLGRAAHRGLYQLGVRRRAVLPRPVVSVGNLTAGGVGKTPFVAWLAARLAAAGLRPAVLARGYGRRPGEEWNDEGRWLAAAVPGLPVLQAPDRRAAALAFLARDDADLFLLDDGFQHERLARDLDLVLIDALCPFGHGHLLPRGLLREPVRALGRAHAVVLTRADAVAPAARDALAARLHALAPAALPVQVRFPVRTVGRAGARHAAEALRGRRLFLCCGVGHPAAVERTVRDLGAELVGSWHLPDHHDFTPADLARLRDAAERHAAELVVTAKDQVKLERLAGGADLAWVLHQEVEVEEGETALLARIRELVRRP